MSNPLSDIISKILHAQTRPESYLAEFSTTLLKSLMAEAKPDPHKQERYGQTNSWERLWEIEAYRKFLLNQNSKYIFTVENQARFLMKVISAENNLAFVVNYLLTNHQLKQTLLNPAQSVINARLLLGLKLSLQKLQKNNLNNAVSDLTDELIWAIEQSATHQRQGSSSLTSIPTINTTPSVPPVIPSNLTAFQTYFKKDTFTPSPPLFAPPVLLLYRQQPTTQNHYTPPQPVEPPFQPSPPPIPSFNTYLDNLNAMHYRSGAQVPH